MTDTGQTPQPKASPQSSGLSFIQPRDTLRTIKARNPRPIANFLRVALPTVVVVVILSLILWPRIKPNTIKTMVMKNIPDLVIDNLNYTGLTTKDEPYSLSAVKATRPGGAQNVFDLDQPQAEVTLASGAWLAAKAKTGHYDQDTRKLLLRDDVELFHDKGYQFTSNEAHVDLKQNTAWGEKPVMIQGSFGEVSGQGFQLLDSGSVMIIRGPAKAVLSLHSEDASDNNMAPQP
ncbi:MAG: LPS export ABC transporter periplasmic protein LptC [Alphaproteobacteria bacterium]